MQCFLARYLVFGSMATGMEKNKKTEKAINGSIKESSGLKRRSLKEAQIQTLENRIWLVFNISYYYFMDI